MDIQFYGANCVRIANKKASIVIDDNLAALGQKAVLKKDDIALFTGQHEPVDTELKLLVDGPGEYEVSEIMITGIQTRSHMDEDGQRTATMYKILIDDVRIAVLGHVHPDLTDAQLERLGVIDVLFVPVGGNGYTLDSVGALKLIKKIEPKIIIPTHYEDKALKFEVPQQPLETALTGLSMEVAETVDKLKLKPADILEGSRLIVLNRA
jgi:L-ascorbate metabolism protein UlaG (beta-lactamase superfamily)